MILLLIFGGGVAFLTWVTADIVSYIYNLSIKPQIQLKINELVAVRDYDRHRKEVAVAWQKKNAILDVEVEDVESRGRSWLVNNKGDFINYEAVEVSTKLTKI